MRSAIAHRCWLAAYYATWLAAGGGTLFLILAPTFGVFGNPWGIDDDVALLGIPIGACLGFLCARSTLASRLLHRALIVAGLVVAALGVIAALTMFSWSRARTGDGPFAGLGEALGGLMALGVAAIGIVWSAVGTTGRLAARTAASALPPGSQPAGGSTGRLQSIV